MPSNNHPHSGMRPVIAIIGNRNAGKSSLMNQIIGQDISIVSQQQGTTTDAVMKAYELVPAGAVTIYDTAGLDDVGELGSQRIKATEKIIARADVVLFVIGQEGLNSELENHLRNLHLKGVKVIPVVNFADERQEDKYLTAVMNLYKGVYVSAKTGKGIDELKQRMAQTILTLDEGQNMLPEWIQAKDVVVLVAPIDSETPRGKMIMPQIQAIREILDRKAEAFIMQPSELKEGLSALRKNPALVITDSQAVKAVAADVPEKIPLTTFSILMARSKWNIYQVSEGIEAIASLKNGDKILIAEGCSHRVTCHDIGRSLIPNLLNKHTGKKLVFEYVSGNDFPEKIDDYKLVVHCGGCMLNQKEIDRRLKMCHEQNIPITNYGMLISLTQGLFERVTSAVL